VRQAARTDGNHATIVEVLEKAGCRVYSTAQLGDGFPDLLVYSDRHPLKTFLVEIKDGSVRPSHRKLTGPELKFCEWWPGPIYVVLDAEDAICAAYGKGRPPLEYAGRKLKAEPEEAVAE
jgi:hypothetical protein